ncbi:hypothetical protein TOPH_00121 [Tolypocladium ophioglossoides CBS 100239]|uniref:Uncharacterized protein n=1 Tax=Tolypocladium ophioglossoides (strain CBS 100239) TaxID=1163406 RepID=A0A0L0NKW6_TOLOC|nr:hypothetical protein TOPH_00121 [Tolypocladium ophioglossoides CBS 100239]
MSTSSRGSSSAAWSDGVGASCASRRRVASLDKEDLAFGLSGTGVPRDGVNAPLEETGRGVSPSLSVTLGWLSPSARGVAWSLGAFLGVWPSLSPSASSSPPSFIPSRLSTSSFSSRISRRSIMPSSMILLNWSRRSFQVSLLAFGENTLLVGRVPVALTLVRVVEKLKPCDAAVEGGEVERQVFLQGIAAGVDKGGRLGAIPAPLSSRRIRHSRGY